MTRFIPNPKMFFWSLQTSFFGFFFVFFQEAFSSQPDLRSRFTHLVHGTQKELLQNAATSSNSKTKPRGFQGVLWDAFCFSFPSQGWALQAAMPSPRSAHAPCSCILAASVPPERSGLGGSCWWDEGHPLLEPEAWILELSSAPGLSVGREVFPPPKDARLKREY